jgi:LIVCS family branched-chain amino acid:cation transporter
MAGLFLIYAWLIYSGSTLGASADPDINRTGLLMLLADSSMGSHAASLLGLLVALACFTTAVSLLVGAGDFFKGLLGDSEKVYRITVIICGLLGILIGQWGVSHIISVAVPVLMLIYPVVICLILLNVLPERLAPGPVFRSVVVVAVLFSIPDFVEAAVPGAIPESIHDVLPFSKEGLGWLLPSLMTFLAVAAYFRFRRD